jgi:hypothetical protein
LKLDWLEVPDLKEVLDLWDLQLSEFYLKKELEVTDLESEIPSEFLTNELSLLVSLKL